MSLFDFLMVKVAAAVVLTLLSPNLNASAFVIGFNAIFWNLPNLRTNVSCPSSNLKGVSFRRRLGDAPTGGFIFGKLGV